MTVGAGLEPARRLGPVADRDHRNAFPAQALERFVERDRDSLDKHEQGAAPSAGEAARLNSINVCPASGSKARKPPLVSS